MFSRFINWLFWRYNPDQRERAQGKMEFWAGYSKGAGGIYPVIDAFHWIPEPVDWWPTIEVVFARGLHGDCQSAAVLGKWAMEQIGKPAGIYVLSRGWFKGRHAVAISDDHTVMVSNNEVVELFPIWEQCVLAYFDNRYKRIKRV